MDNKKTHAKPNTPPIKKDDTIFAMMAGIGVKGTPYVKYAGFIIFLNKTLSDPTDALKVRRIKIQNVTTKYGFGEEIEHDAS